MELGEAWRPSPAREVQSTAGDQQRTGDLNAYFCEFEQFSLPTNLTSESITPSSSYSNKLLLTWRGLGALSESCSLTSPVLSTLSDLNYWGTCLRFLEWTNTSHPGAMIILPTVHHFSSSQKLSDNSIVGFIISLRMRCCTEDRIRIVWTGATETISSVTWGNQMN